MFAGSKKVCHQKHIAVNGEIPGATFCVVNVCIAVIAVMEDLLLQIKAFSAGLHLNVGFMYCPKRKGNWHS